MPIVVEKLNHAYMEGSTLAHDALKDVTLTIGDGEFLGLIGHTGSGKSTFVQHLNGLLQPTSGSVTVDGFDMADKKQRVQGRRLVGMVFQYPEHQMICDTVWEDVAFGPSKQGLTGEACETRVEEALRFVDLPEKYYQASPLQLSGGQKRRVAIAGVLAMHPEYIILDEPAAGLDAAGKREIFDRIRRMSREQGIGVLLVSHSMEDLAEYADRIIVLDDGKKILDDRPAQIFAKRETLADCGLDVPETVKLADKLRANGYQIPQNVILEKELLDYLGNCTNSTAGRKSVDTENRLDERKQGDNL